MNETVETRFMKLEEIDEVLRITVEAFDGFSIDQNLEKRFPQGADNTWQNRKAAATRKQIEDSASECMVVTVNGTIAGYLSFSADPNSKIAYIHNLAVDEEYRDRGLSRKLFEASFAHFKKLGMKSCRIETLEQNTLCKSYYPRVGFEEIACQICYGKML